MTLVIEIEWSEAATEVAVVDTAAHSRVGEGQAPNPDPVDGLVDPSGWWDAAVRATALAIDGLSAIGLQVAELRAVVVGAGDPAGGLVALDAAGQPVHPAIVGSRGLEHA
jgi:sugar (pentulose or hexulose) kinase